MEVARAILMTTTVWKVGQAMGLQSLLKIFVSMVHTRSHSETSDDKGGAFWRQPFLV